MVSLADVKRVPRNPMFAIEPGETIVDAMLRHRQAFGPGPLLLVADFNISARPSRSHKSRIAA